MMNYQSKWIWKHWCAISEIDLTSWIDIDILNNIMKMRKYQVTAI